MWRKRLEYCTGSRGGGERGRGAWEGRGRRTADGRAALRMRGRNANLRQGSLNSFTRRASGEQFSRVIRVCEVRGIETVLGRKSVVGGKCHDCTELLIEQTASIALE